MTTQQRTGKHSTNSHFTFGNDEWKVEATYQCDFTCAKAFPTRKSEKQLPPPCAEVIPYIPKTLEREKWASSTMRDFTGFGEYSRKQVYEASKASFKSNKALQTSKLGLLQEDFRIPMTTVYGVDFNTNMSGAQMPKCARRRQALLQTSSKPLPSSSDQFITEAQYAFKWPSTDRLKLPMHLQRPSVSK